MGCDGVFLTLCQVIRVFLGQPGEVEVNRFAHWQRCEECSEWGEEWNERRERVCAGAEREVASSRAQAAATSPGQQEGQAAAAGRAANIPGADAFRGHDQGSEFTASPVAVSAGVTLKENKRVCLKNTTYNDLAKYLLRCSVRSAPLLSSRTNQCTLNTVGHFAHIWMRFTWCRSWKCCGLSRFIIIL